MTDIIANKLDLHPDNYVNTWQSESDIGMPWIKPDVLEYLRAQEKTSRTLYIYSIKLY